VLLPSDMGSVYIVSKLARREGGTADYNSGKAAIGTGPYKFAEYVPNQRVVLKANYRYWGGEEPVGQGDLQDPHQLGGARGCAAVQRRPDDRDGTDLGHRQAVAGQEVTRSPTRSRTA
jgi:peptide/nickel transport system substrate-binding protein